MAGASDGILEGSGLSIVLDLIAKFLQMETLYQKIGTLVTRLTYSDYDCSRSYKVQHSDRQIQV